VDRLDSSQLDVVERLVIGLADLQVDNLYPGGLGLVGSAQYLIGAFSFQVMGAVGKRHSGANLTQHSL
jgi:hypothetical protein